MVKTIYIYQKLRESVESYLRKNDSNKEYGGFFLGEKDTLIIPFFLKNKSNNQNESYLTPSYWKEVIDSQLNLLNLEYYVHFHTHPNHSFYSLQDLKVGHSESFTKDSIVILFDKQNDNYTWRSYDNNFEENYVQIIDKNYDNFKEYFAKNLGLICLRDLFLTQKGDFITTDNLAKVLLNPDKDVFKLYNYLNELSKRNSFISTYKKISDDLGLNVVKIKKILNLFQKNNLFTNLLKNR